MIRELLQWARAELTLADISEVDAELLMAHVLGLSRKELHIFTPDLFGSEKERIDQEFRELISARLTGRPTQYLIGEAPFRHLVLEVGEGVLIPRPETEGLVDLVLSALPHYGQPTSVIDLGAGSGAIALSIAAESANKHQTSVIAVEKEEPALRWLERNVAKSDLPVRVVHADVADALSDVKADIVVANPPYIPQDEKVPFEVEYEPSTALFGGDEDGLKIPLMFIGAATRLLKPSGFFAMEHHESQADFLMNVMQDDYLNIQSHKDLNQRPRWITGVRKANR